MSAVRRAVPPRWVAGSREGVVLAREHFEWCQVGEDKKIDSERDPWEWSVHVDEGGGDVLGSWMMMQVS